MNLQNFFFIVFLFLFGFMSHPYKSWSEETSLSTPPPLKEEVFCKNIQNTAQDARFSWQVKKLQDLSRALAEKTKILEEKRAETEKWLKKRADFIAKAHTHLLEIYSSLKPEAAASQLSALEDTMAVSILSQMNPKTASTILNEVEPTRAAQFTKLLIELSARPQKEASPSTQGTQTP